MLHDAAFHQGLHCLLGQNQSSENEIITCDPSIYTMDHPDLLVTNLMENSIKLKSVNTIRLRIAVCIE